MSSRIYLEDDGDEVVFVKINEEVIGTIDHESYGWAGMQEVIELIETIADAFGIPLTNTQDIV